MKNSRRTGKHVQRKSAPKQAKERPIEVEFVFGGQDDTQEEGEPANLTGRNKKSKKRASLDSHARIFG